MGTALNKILKDMITRFHQMNGKDSVYVQVGIAMVCQSSGKLRNNTKKERNKDEVPVKDFRQNVENLPKAG